MAAPRIPPSAGVVPAAPIATKGKRVYDVAVLGPDVAGAATAALLAKKRGLRVLVATLGPPALARESEGWLFPTALPLTTPLRQLSGATDVLEELGIVQDLQRLGTGSPGAFQLLSADLRLALPADPARRRAELRRAMEAAEAVRVEAALASLDKLGQAWDPFLVEPPLWPPRGFFEERKVKKTIPTPPPLPEGLVGDLLQTLAPFCTSLQGPSAPEAIAREAAAFLRAPFKLWGGAAQLADMLRRKAQEGGAEISGEPCTELRLDRKGATFLLGGSEIKASSVVLACAPAAIAALCDGGGRTERHLAEEAALQVDRKIVLAHFVIGPDGLPIALEEAALFLGAACGPLVLATQPARRAKGPVSGERLLTVARIADPSFDDGAGLLSTIRDTLEPILPFFDRHLRHQWADTAPVHSHPLFAPAPEERAYPPLGLRPTSASHDRVLFASGGVYPGFGLEGAMVCAKAASAQATAS